MVKAHVRDLLAPRLERVVLHSDSLEFRQTCIRLHWGKHPLSRPTTHFKLQMWKEHLQAWSHLVDDGKDGADCKYCAVVTGLKPGILYHFRLRAFDHSDVSESWAEAAFSTSQRKPLSRPNSPSQSRQVQSEGKHADVNRPDIVATRRRRQRVEESKLASSERRARAAEAEDDAQGRATPRDPPNGDKNTGSDPNGQGYDALPGSYVAQRRPHPPPRPPAQFEHQRQHRDDVEMEGDGAGHENVEPPWQVHYDSEDFVYYWNADTGESRCENGCDCVVAYSVSSGGQHTRCVCVCVCVCFACCWVSDSGHASPAFCIPSCIAKHWKLLKHDISSFRRLFCGYWYWQVASPNRVGRRCDWLGRTHGPNNWQYIFPPPSVEQCFVE